MGGARRGAGRKKQLVAIEVRAALAAKVDKIASVTGNDTKAEVVADAIRLLDFILKSRFGGGHLELFDASTSKTFSLLIVGQERDPNTVM